MPTYDYVCKECGQPVSVVQSMRSYREAPIVPEHCGQAAERHLSVIPAMSGLANALAGDRHYQGLRAPDGTDIGSRTRHREYMKQHGLTTTDDFSGDWMKKYNERQKFRRAEHTDRALKEEISKQVMGAKT